MYCMFTSMNNDVFLFRYNIFKVCVSVFFKGINTCGISVFIDTVLCGLMKYDIKCPLKPKNNQR